MDSDSSSDDEPVAQNQQFLSLKSRLNQQNSPNKYNNTINEELAAAGAGGIVCVDTEEHASHVIKLLRLKNESNIRHQRLDNNTRRIPSLAYFNSVINHQPVVISSSNSIPLNVEMALNSPIDRVKAPVNIKGRRPIPKEGNLELKAEYGEKLVDPKMDNNDDWSSGDDDDLVDPRYSYSRRMAKMKDGTASNSSIDSNYSNNNALAQAYERNTVNNKVYHSHQTNTIVKVIEGKPSSDSNNITIQEASVDAYTLFADRTQDNSKPIIKVEDWDSDDDDDYDEEMSHKLSQGFVAPTVTSMGYSVNIQSGDSRSSRVSNHSFSNSTGLKGIKEISNGNKQVLAIKPGQTLRVRPPVGFKSKK